LSHHPTFRDPDDEPEEPDMPETGETKPAEALVNDLETRLFKGRKVMVFGQITDKLARDVVARILALVDESAKPIQVYVIHPEVMSSRVTRSMTSSSLCVPARRST
jgi:ATP-dependent Clp protease protease subunit